MFVKAKFITSIWSSIKMALIGLQRIYGFCQDQPPTFDDRARSLYIATTGVSSEANVRRNWDEDHRSTEQGAALSLSFAVLQSSTHSPAGGGIHRSGGWGCSKSWAAVGFRKRLERAATGGLFLSALPAVF